MSLFRADSHLASAAPGFAAVAIALTVLAGCGFQPLYAPRENNANAATELASVRIQPIKDRAGQQLRNFLLDRFNPQGRPTNPKYGLNVELSEFREDLAIRKDETATRANLIISASYRLTEAASGQQLFRATSRVTTSFNIIRSEFGAISAENAARRRGAREISDDIRTRVAVFFNRRGGGGGS